MMFFPPRLSPHSSIWLANLVVVVLAISIIALIVERLLRSRSLPTRHGIHLSGLMLTAAAPWLLLAAFQLGWGVVVSLAWDEAVAVKTNERPIESVAMNAQIAAPMPNAAPSAATQETALPLTVGDLLGPGEVMEFHTPTAGPSHTSRQSTDDDRPLATTEPVNPTRHIDWRPVVATVGGWCIAIWCAGILAALLRLLAGWRQVRRLTATLQPVEESALHTMLSRAANTVGLRQSPTLMSSTSVPVPAVCGLWRPVIILPAQFTEATCSASLEAILLHECAHIQRRDLWVGWLQRIVGAIFWWNIPLYGVQRRLNDLREDLCDNHVLAQHPDGRGYARVLLDLVSRASGSRPIPVSVGLVEGPSSGLSARITRLLREDRNMATRLNKGPAASLAAFVMLMAAAISGLSLRTETAADDDATDANQTATADGAAATGDIAADTSIENLADESAEAEGTDDQLLATPEPLDPRVIVSPLFYDDQVLALVTREGAAVVKFARADNGIVNYQWRYLSAADAVLDPKTVPSPHEQTGEGTLEQIMSGPMPYIDAGPIDLLWSPGTELRGWVSFYPDEMEVLPVKPSLFAEEKHPYGILEALDLSSLLITKHVDTTEHAGEPGPARQHLTSKVVYDDMILVVSNSEGVAAFEFYESFVEGDLQTLGRDGVRYRSLYRGYDGSVEAAGSSEVYELYKDGNYNQGQLYLDAGSVHINWSMGDSECGWIYFDPLREHCWLISREYFEQLIPKEPGETGRAFDLLRFRQGQRPLTPPVDPSRVADAEPVAVADDADVEQERQQKIAVAIAQGTEFLITRQQQSGSWVSENLGAHPIGVHSLVLLGLLEAGRPIDDPAIANGLEWLRNQPDPDQTYDIALMIMALAAAGDENDRPRIATLAAALQDGQIEAGAWGYNAGGGNWWDNSNSQYAVFGLNAAHQAESDIDVEVVRNAFDHYLGAQIGDVDGEDGAGWNYRGDIGGTVSGNMTASAIASLIILSEILEDQPELSEEDAARIAVASKAIEAGQRWLASHFTVRTNPGENNWVLCYLMNLRHAAELAELTMIGDHDWYREGADFLVDGQNVNDGSWVSATEIDPVVATSMALLFLSAGLDDAEQAVSFLPPENPPITPGPMPSTGGANPFVTQPPVSQETPTAPTNPPLPTEPDPFGDPNQQSQPGYEFTRDLHVAAASSDGPRTIVLLHLEAATDGSLGELRFFNESLGSGSAAIDLLAGRIEQLKSERATARELYHLVAHVTADESLQYGAVVGVMDACRTAGIEDLKLSTGATDGAIVASVGYLRDASGRKISDDPILSLPRATGSVEEAVDLFQNLSERLASEVHEHGGPLLPRDLVFQLNVDHEIPSDVVQRIIQHAADAGFEKFSLKSLGGEEAPDPATSSAPVDDPEAQANIIGEVINIDEPNQLVELSIGSDDGIVMGRKYSIWRYLQDIAGFDLVALCEVTTMSADQSVARITATSNPETFPRVGDKLLPEGQQTPRTPVADPATSSSDEAGGANVDEDLRHRLIASALGLELEPIAATDDRLAGTRFHGGLEVTEVQADGPAAGEGIQVGDILVGLHQWETISLDNVAFVVTHREVRELKLVMFYLVREGVTLFGVIDPANEATAGGFSSADALTEEIDMANDIPLSILQSHDESSTFVTLETVTVDLNEDRFSLHAAVRLQIPEDQMGNVQLLLDEHRVELRSWMQGYLSELSTDDIRGVASQLRILRRIKDRFNAVLYPNGDGVISNVFFQQFSLQ